MKWTEMMLVSLVTAAGVVGLGHLASEWSARPAQAASERQSGHRHGLQRMCADPASIDYALGYVKTELRLSAAQAPEWDRFAATVGVASERLRRACASDARDAQDAATALAATEDQLAAGLDWLKEVRPAFVELYAQLDQRQRTLLDTRLKRGHGHR